MRAVSGATLRRFRRPAAAVAARNALFFSFLRSRTGSLSARMMRAEAVGTTSAVALLWGGKNDEDEGDTG